MIGSTVMLFANFGLYYHRGTPFQRQLYSTTMGLMIHYYVFAWSGLASLATNTLSYLAIILMPKSYSHITICAQAYACILYTHARKHSHAHASIFTHTQYARMIMYMQQY